MIKRFFYIIAIVILGGIGGVLMERTIVPWLAQHTSFARIPGLILDRVTIVQPKEEIIVDRTEGLKRSVDAVRSAVVRVERRDLQGRLQEIVSGVVFTSDGLVVTSESIVGSGTYTVVGAHGTLEGELDRQDYEKGIALFRIDAQNLTVTDVAEPKDLSLGETVFLISAAAILEDVTKLSPQLEVSIVTQESDGEIPGIGIAFDATMRGAPLFTFEGKLIGIVGSGDVLVPASTVRGLIETEG